MDEQPHLLVSPSVVFRAAGNACADALARVAALEALPGFLPEAGESPPQKDQLQNIRVKILGI